VQIHVTSLRILPIQFWQIPITVRATNNLDSQVFAYITSDSNLFTSAAALGLPGLNYADFDLRGLETGDTTTFNGANTDISWFASSPGDWTRLMIACSPSANVPEPGMFIFFLTGLIGLLARGIKK
jgi:hypothetical protein